MKVQHENKAMSSTLLFVDHYICKAGEAFTNHESLIYPTDNLINGYYTYSLPFHQIVADSSISNATIMTGVYVNGDFKDIGEGDLNSIDHYNGRVHFEANKNATTISGKYAVKEFNTYITTDSEEKILFETKYSLRPRIDQTISGLPPSTKTYPAIFIKNAGGRNEPLCFGGIDTTITNIRSIVLADSAYQLDAVCCIMKDMARKKIPIIENLPFNAIGAYTGLSYNYNAVATGDGPYIWDVNVSKMDIGEEVLKNMDSAVHAAFIDLELQTYRGTAL